MVCAKSASKNENCCHDCKKELEVKDGEVSGGVFLVYQDGLEKINILKCNDCFSSNPGLTNYQPCEVYSRIVGYLRPVQQWNVGKAQEYGERKEFKLSK